MRITNKVLVKGYLGDLTRNLENMRKYQEQLSSGKEIRRPSDNPFRVARSMELHNGISVNERYKTNIDEGIGWLETTDKALGQIGDALQRVRELAVAGGNGAYGPQEKESIKKEMEQIKGQIVQIGNTAFDGRYIFGGDKTTEIPFDQTGKYNGSTEGLNREFTQGVILDIATRGDQFQQVFTCLDDLISKLGSGESTSSEIGKVTDVTNQVLNLRAEVGAKSNRLEAMSNKNDEETFNMTELLAKTEDIDVAAKVMEYKVMESIYTASLQTGAKILQPSILDFLR